MRPIYRSLTELLCEVTMHLLARIVKYERETQQSLGRRRRRRLRRLYNRLLLRSF